MPTPASRQEFAALVNETRTRQHLSIRAVARIAGVPSATAQGWLNGRHFPTPALRRNYLELVEHLGLSDAVPEDLWDGAWETFEPALTGGRAPYLGLRPFGVGDHDLFFGRTEQAERLAGEVAALAAREGHGLVALVGPSGSGKSSVLAAGLLGSKVGAGILAGWAGVEVTVARLATGAAPVPASGRHVIVVDQFEDALMLPGDARARLLASLEALASCSVVVLGMRSDAFAEASLIPLLEQALSRPVLVAPLSRSELREVITCPAESLGLEVEESLVQLLLDELAPATAAGRVAAGTLPLLSNALLLTWAASDGSRLTIRDYHAAGGVAGAVDRLAEEVYLSLQDTQRAEAERLFLRLVRVSADSVERDALPLAAVEPATRPVLNAFVAARMLTTVDDEVRISHQALLSHWGRLNDWLAAHRDDLVVMGKLRRASEVWVDSGREPDALIPVTRLAVFTEWLSSGGKRDLLTPVEREFVAASEHHFDSVLDAERATSERLRRRGRVAVTMAVLGLALALVAGFLFLRGQVLQVQAEEARRDAQSRQIATTAGELRSQDPNLQAQMAVLSRDLAVTTESTSAVLAATSVSVPTRWLGEAGATLAATSDGTLLARGDGAGGVTLWTGDAVATSPGTRFTAAVGAVSGLALVRTGEVVLLGVAGKGTARVWDVTAAPVLVADLIAPGAEQDATAVAFGARGSLAAFGVGGEVRLWRAGSGQFESDILRPTTTPGSALPAITSLAFTDEVLHVAGPTGAVSRWMVGGWRRLSDLRFPRVTRNRVALALALSPDGHTLVAGLATKSLLRWRLDGRSAAPGEPIDLFQDWVNSVAFSPDGSLLLAGSSDQLTRVFDAASGVLLRSLHGPSVVTGTAVVAGHVVTAGTEGTLRVWPGIDPTWRSGGSEMYNLSTDADGGTWLAGGTLEDGIQLWRIDGKPRAMAKPDSGLPPGTQSGAVAVAPNGSYLLGATFDGRVLSWPLSADGARGTASVVDVGLGYISFVQAAPNSRLVVAMGYTGTECALLEADSFGRLRIVSRMATPNPQMVWFSADSATLAVALPDRRVVLWDVSEPETPVIKGEVAGLDSPPISIAFAPRSPLLAIGTESGEVSVWDVTAPTGPVRIRSFGDPHSAPNCVLFSPDEDLLVAASGDERIWGWDLNRPDETPTFTLSGELDRPWDIRFLAGDRMAVSGGNGALRVWQVDPETAEREICASRGAPLTTEEWSRYLPGIAVGDPCSPRR